MWGRQLCSLSVAQRAVDGGGRDEGYLITVHESQTVIGAQHYSVEKILFGNLQDVLDLADRRS